jgi:hypothetical protein
MRFILISVKLGVSAPLSNHLSEIRIPVLLECELVADQLRYPFDGNVDVSENARRQ